MVVFLFALSIALSVLGDLYIWFGFIKGSSWILSLLHFLPSVLIVLLPIAYQSDRLQNVVFPAFIFLAVFFILPKCFFVLCSLIGRGIGVFAPAAFGLGNIVGLTLVVVYLIVVVYAMGWGWKRVVVHSSEIVCQDLPRAFDGYKIVHLSDFHIGTYASKPSIVANIVARVNAQNADVIFFTGDLVNGHPDELRPFLDELSRLRAKDGVYSVLGNHDYCFYHNYTSPETPQSALDTLAKLESQMGWRLLRNENAIFRRGKDSIAILGVENEGTGPFVARADMAKAMSGLEKDVFKILLSHDPTHWRKAIVGKNDIPLTLSGHTHAMQFSIFGVSPAVWAYPEWGGLYSEGAQQLFVSTGVGSNVKFRFGAWCEIDVLTLRCE